jgi:hypothetical protein
MAMGAERKIIYIDEPPQIEIRKGLVHITVPGDGDFVMSPLTFRQSIRIAAETLAEWEVGQARPVPFKRD